MGALVTAKVWNPGAVLAGSPQAQLLLRDVAADPATECRAVVIGPGGHGKSVLLGVLAGVYENAGVPVVHDLPAPGEAPAPDAALLVDDAHLLSDAQLTRLAARAAQTGGRMVVAHRPFPERPALAALDAALATQSRPVLLDVLDRPGIAVRAGCLGTDDAAAVHRRTAGIPALVDLLLAADDPSGDPSPELLAQLGYSLEALAPGVRDLLLARAIGAPADAEVLVPLLGLPDTTALDALGSAAWADGKLLAGGGAVPLVSAAVLARTSQRSVLEMRLALAEIELRRGGDVLAAARGLLRAGATGSRVAAVLVAAGDQSVRAGAGAAEELYEAAIRAGARPLELAPRRAEAAVVTGDLDEALAHADEVLAAVDDTACRGGGGADTDGVRAATVAAAVLARRGNLARSAELYRWMAPDGSVLAVPALIGTGALDEARASLVPSGGSRRPPTLRSGAEELIAQGVHESVAGSATSAMSKLVRAAALLEPPSRAALLSDTPAALAALVAVQCGELAVAQSVLERAVRVGLGGCGAAVRHRLLLGWIAMYRGAHSAARAALGPTNGVRLEPRDELLAAALEVALARRASDPAALMVGWARAREAIVHHPVDLYVLQPLAELRVAAARLREQSWVAPHLDEAAALLRRLGDPLLWAAPLHWGGVHAAMFADTPDAAAPDVAALEAGSSTSRYAAAMAIGARQWLLVLRGEVDAAAVESAARGLHAVGLSWDGGRLAGQAAIRTRDKKAMGTLLGTARALQNAGPAAPVTEDAPAAVPEDREDVLSDREREVAALVLEGLTYKQIGEQLFISSKTVEHHVARMRQRLGSASRGELFAHLRTIVR